jgi:hypothetical protein
MKLADVSPRLLALLREDAITLDQLAALALADDHETQEHILCRRRHKPRYQEQEVMPSMAGHPPAAMSDPL